MGPLVVPELAEAAFRTRDVALAQGRTRVDVRTHAGRSVRVGAGHRGATSRPRQPGRRCREPVPGVDRPARPYPCRVRRPLAGICSTGSGCAAGGAGLDAREQLRTAHHMLETMGIEAFAARARRELRATGETARKRTDETRAELTAQEAVIARLARDGLSNPEIGTGCSSVPVRSSTTCTRFSPSSPSARAASSTVSCPATRPPASRSNPPGPASRVGTSGRRLASLTGHWRMRARQGADDAWAGRLHRVDSACRPALRAGTTEDTTDRVEAACITA